MWFKKITVFEIGEKATEITEQALSEIPFAPCGATEPERIGFVPCIGETYVHEAAGFKTFTVKHERKILPPAVIREEVDKQIAEIENREGRNVNRKEKARMKDEMMFTLLPRALSKTTTYQAILTPSRRLIIGANEAVANTVCNLLRLALGSLPVSRYGFNAPLPSKFTHWLSEHQSPKHFQLVDHVVLSSEDGTARLTGVNPFGSEVGQHIDSGKEAKSIGMFWDGEISFVVDHGFKITGIHWGENLRCEVAENSADEAAEFDASLAIVGLALDKMLGQLIDALGGTAK